MGRRSIWLGGPRVRGDDGGALVEAALLLPFIVIIVFATIDVGRAYALKNRLTNMAREGASYGQFFPTRVTDAGPNCTVDARNVTRNITDRAKAEDPGLADQVTVTVTNKTTDAVLTGCETGVASPGDRLEVEVTPTGGFKLLTPVARSVIGKNTLAVTGQIEVVVQG